jgi:hypothetical protein
MRRSRGREFDYEAVAPAVPGVKERLHDELSLAAVALTSASPLRILTRWRAWMLRAQLALLRSAIR